MTIHFLIHLIYYLGNYLNKKLIQKFLFFELIIIQIKFELKILFSSFNLFRFLTLEIFLVLISLEIKSRNNIWGAWGSYDATDPRDQELKNYV